MTVLIDTNVVIRHLTQEPADQGQAASRFLADCQSLWLTDVIAAEVVYVLQSVYRAPRETIATALRALLAMRSVVVERGSVLLRGIELYEREHLDFTDAYLVAFAEANGGAQIASFDQGIEKTVRKVSAVRTVNPLTGTVAGG